jgi:hypothetical protein
MNADNIELQEFLGNKKGAILYKYLSAYK